MVFKGVIYFTQEEGHCLREGGEEHARGYVSKNTTNLLVKFLLRHPHIPLLRCKRNALLASSSGFTGSAQKRHFSLQLRSLFRE